MSAYFGTIGERITLDVSLVNEYSYDTYFGHRTQTHHVYILKDEEDHVFVWNTTSFLSKAGEDAEGNFICIRVNKNDKVRIVASIKDHNEYRGQEQTVLQRVKLLEVLERALTKEEIEEIKRAEQLETLKDDDFVWRMPYKQYKEHYSDCETLFGSFDRDMYRGATIEVIIRSGRLKNSGVRGKKFYGFRFKNENDQFIVYRAVSEENATKRVEKEFPENKWELYTIYNY